MCDLHVLLRRWGARPCMSAGLLTPVLRRRLFARQMQRAIDAAAH